MSTIVCTTFCLVMTTDKGLYLGISGNTKSCEQRILMQRSV